MKKIFFIIMGCLLLWFLGIQVDRVPDETAQKIAAEQERQSRAQAVIEGEVTKLVLTVKNDIVRTEKYEKQPSYAIWTYRTNEIYAAFEKRSVNQAQEQGWTLIDKGQKDTGPLLFYKRLRGDDGACELVVEYELEQQACTARITWIEPVALLKNK